MDDSKDFNDEYDFASILISSVREKRCLYDRSDMCYSNKSEKEKAWRDIAAKIDKPVIDCRKKWKLLRERYAREIKKKTFMPKSALAKIPEWQLFKEIDFLKGSISSRKRYTQRVGIEDITPSEPKCDVKVSVIPTDALLESPPPPKKKITSEDVFETLNKAAHLLAKDIARPSDADTNDMFLKTIHSLMLDLPTHARDMYMKEMFTKLMDLREECFN